jgi:hypothetical protein
MPPRPPVVRGSVRNIVERAGARKAIRHRPAHRMTAWMRYSQARVAGIFWSPRQRSVNLLTMLGAQSVVVNRFATWRDGFSARD